MASPKIIVTPQQRANAIEARDVMWPSVSPEDVYREFARQRTAEWFEPSCGSVVRFGKWFAWWPAFRAQAVKFDEYGATRIMRWWHIAGHLFGDTWLFVSRENHPADKDFTGTDHALVTHRLNWLIEHSEVAS